jgi:hypothetical protein
VDEEQLRELIRLLPEARPAALEVVGEREPPSALHPVMRLAIEVTESERLAFTYAEGTATVGGTAEVLAELAADFVDFLDWEAIDAPGEHSHFEPAESMSLFLAGPNF